MEIRGADEIDSVALNVDYTRCNPTPGSACESKTLEEVQAYLGHPELIIMSNQQRFDGTIYGHTTVVSEAVIWNQHIDKSQANWMQTTFDSKFVFDETNYLDLGITTPRPFNAFKLD